MHPFVLQLAGALAHGVTRLEQCRIGQREAGLGRVGRQRFTAVVDHWCGGSLARAAQALAPSAWLWWDETRTDTSEMLSLEALRHAVRARDLWRHISLGLPKNRWVVRRLAPDSGKVTLTDLPMGGRLEDDLWRAMGREVANVHVPLGDIRTDWVERNTNATWLCKAADARADKSAED